MTDAAGIVPSALALRRRAAAAGLLAADDAARLARPWAELAEHAADDNLFFHPDFALPAMACFGHGRVSLAAVHSGGQLIAAAPFTAARLGHLAPAVRLWSHPYGPLGVPLLDPDRVDEAAAALLSAIAPGPSRRAVIIPDLPLDGPVAAALARAARSSRRSTAIIGRCTRAVGRRDGTQLGSNLSRHRRREYARLIRRLGDEGHVTIETAAEPLTVQARLTEFLALEQSGWKGQGGTALASSASRADFARTAITSRVAAGAVRVHSLRLNGRPLAALITFLSGRTAFTWKIAYDEARARFSPGVQVMLAAIGSLIAEPAVARIDSCAGENNPVADSLLPDRMAMGTYVISPVGQGALYRAGLIAARGEAAMIRRAKRMRDRL